MLLKSVPQTSSADGKDSDDTECEAPGANKTAAQSPPCLTVLPIPEISTPANRARRYATSGAPRDSGCNGAVSSSFIVKQPVAEGGGGGGQQGGMSSTI